MFGLNILLRGIWGLGGMYGKTLTTSVRVGGYRGCQFQRVNHHNSQ